MVIFVIKNVFAENPSTPVNISDNLKEMDYIDGTKIEHKYSLPVVNASVLSDNNGTMGVNTVPASLSRVLDFYNTELLSANWDRVQKGLSSDCRQNMQKYIDGLFLGDNWALKSKSLKKDIARKSCIINQVALCNLKNNFYSIGQHYYFHNISVTS